VIGKYFNSKTIREKLSRRFVSGERITLAVTLINWV
jgi:hypothetical protein